MEAPSPSGDTGQSSTQPTPEQQPVQSAPTSVQPPAPAPTPVQAPQPTVPTGIPATGNLSINGPFPQELDGWNWGAFLLNWMWAIGNSVWIGLLMFVPFVNMVMPFYLGAKGNQLAWEHRKFASVQQFKDVQNAWKSWGFILIIVQIALVATFILMVLNFVNDLPADDSGFDISGNNLDMIPYPTTDYPATNAIPEPPTFTY